MDAISSLLLQLRDPATGDEAYEELSTLGAAALGALEASMLAAHDDATFRELCAQLLGQIVPEGVDRLFCTLADGDDDQADLAAWGLRFHHAATMSEQRLLDMLRSKSPRLRSRAARAFRYIHVDLTSCPAEMVTALRDDSSDVRLDGLRMFTELADVGLERYEVSDAGGLRDSARRALQDPILEVRLAAEQLLSVLEGADTE